MTQFWWKYLQRYGIQPVFRAIACDDFNLWLQKLISTSTKTKTSVTKIWWNSFRWVLRYGVHEVFCCDLNVMPFDLISVSQALIHTCTSPNVGEISSNTLEDSVFTRFYGSLPETTLTVIFDFLTLKTNQHICECKYICDQNWANCLYWYGRYDMIRLLWPWPLIFDVISMSPP